jgi:hypothetical protein
MFIATSNGVFNLLCENRMEIIVSELTTFVRQLRTWFNDKGFEKKIRIVEGYTRKSGVRGLEAKISSHHAAKSVAMEESTIRK